MPHRRMPLPGLSRGAASKYAPYKVRREWHEVACPYAAAQRSNSEEDGFKYNNKEHEDDRNQQEDNAQDGATLFLSFLSLNQLFHSLVYFGRYLHGSSYCK